MGFLWFDVMIMSIFRLQPRRDATHVVANLQRQRVDTKLIACTYLEANFDIMDTLILE